MKAIGSSLNTLVVGEPGIGKSSMLHHVESELRRLDRPVVFVRGESERDVAGLLQRVEDALVERKGQFSETVLQLKSIAREGWGPEARSAGKIDRTDVVTRLEWIGKLAGDEDGPLTVLLDGVPSAAAGFELFGRLRDELWELPLCWVVAARPADAQALLTPPADAFFSEQVRMRPLDAAATRHLIDLRLGEHGKPVADAIVRDAIIAELGGGIPRLVLDYARQLAQGRVDPEGLRERVREREQRLEQLTDAQMRLYLTLEQLGPVSASDEALLRELGWSRPRASVVLRQLEEAGLVSSANAPATSGRPKKVFALADR